MFKLAPKSADFPKSNPKIRNPWKAIFHVEQHLNQPSWVEDPSNWQHCFSEFFPDLLAGLGSHLPREGKGRIRKWREGGKKRGLKKGRRWELAQKGGLGLPSLKVVAPCIHGWLVATCMVFPVLEMSLVRSGHNWSLIMQKCWYLCKKSQRFVVWPQTKNRQKSRLFQMWTQRTVILYTAEIWMTNGSRPRPSAKTLFWQLFDILTGNENNTLLTHLLTYLLNNRVLVPW